MITVGFDLDLTIADTREGIAVAFERLSAATGVAIDANVVVSRLGPPLEVELAYWFPAEDVPAIADRYREFYGEVAVSMTVPMPGAAAAVDAVRACGGEALVVTAKNQRDAEAIVGSLDLGVTHVVGSLFGEAKGTALREHGAGAYVGDHVADIDAARAAGAHSIAVATGSYAEEELRAHGADIVLPDLWVFPETLTELIGRSPASRQ